MEYFKVSQVAKILGITPTAVYKKFKTCSELIQNHVHKERGIIYITKEGFEILKATMAKTLHRSEESCKIEPVQNLVESLQKELDRKQSIIETLIIQQEEQRKRTDTILMKLTSDISTLQKALEHKKEEKPAPIDADTLQLKPCKPWIAPQVKDPLEGLTWYQRVWIELFKPEALRSKH